MKKATKSALVGSLLAGGLLLAGCGGAASTSGSASVSGSAGTSSGAYGSSATSGSASSAAPASSSSSSSGSSASASGSGNVSTSVTGGSGSGSGTSAAASASANISAFQKKYLSIDASAKTVTWTLDGGAMNGSSPFAYDGDSNGKMVLTVPKGWKVKVNFKNVGKLAHSAVIVKQKTDKKPAFPGATTPHATSGTAPGSTYSYSFTPTSTGTLYAVCVVPGHEQAGMWTVIKVVASGQPSLKG